jgi:hypothetical protein
MSTPPPRLATSIWVQAQIRLCDIRFIPIAIVNRGDNDAGAVLLRLLRGRDVNFLLRRHTQLDGNAEWVVVPGGEPVDDETADAHFARERERDPDLWIVEIEDFGEKYWPED